MDRSPEVNTLNNRTTNETDTLRAKLKANGWHWLPGQGKGILYRGWNKGDYDYDTAEFQASENPAWSNTGILCGVMIARDVDAKVPSTAAKLKEPALLGASECGTRYGSKGSAKFYRAVVPMRSITVRGIAPGGTKKSTIVEYIGMTRQLMCFGIHPDTGKPYRWEGKSPCDVSTTGFTKYAREDFMAQAAKDKEIALADGWTDVTITVQATDSDKVEAREGNGGLVSIEMLEKMLSHIDPGKSHDECLPVIGALKHAEACQLVCDPETLEPDEDFSAKDVAVKWSRGEYQPGKEPPANYAEGWAEARYDSMNPFKVGGAKFGSLVTKARDGDYKGQSRIDSLMDHADIEDSELPSGFTTWAEFLKNIANGKEIPEEPEEPEEPKAKAHEKEAKAREKNWEGEFLSLLKPYQAKDPTTLPNMAWLYGTSALRGEVGITIATSGVGKTSLKLLFLYDMATASLMLEKLHKGPLRVGFISFEDSQDVLERRIEAIRKHYGGSDDIFQDRLYLKSFLGLGFRFTELNDDSVVILNERAFSVLRKFITQNKIDYLCMDPWVHMHEFPESENVQIAKLVERIKGIASKTKCFIDIVHHTRKTMHGQSETTQEDSRGASSLVNATRVKRIISLMSVGEASKCKIPELERWRYVKIVDGNVNHSPRRTGGEWYKKIGVKLGNAQKPSELAPGEIPYEEDDVGVMLRMELATVSMLVTEAQVATILQIITATPHREDNQAKGEPRLVDAIAEATGVRWEDETVRSTLKAIRARLFDYKVLAREERKDKNRKSKFYVVPGSQPCLPEHVVEPSSEIEDNGDDF